VSEMGQGAEVRAEAEAAAEDTAAAGAGAEVEAAAGEAASASNEAQARGEGEAEARGEAAAGETASASDEAQDGESEAESRVEAAAGETASASDEDAAGTEAESAANSAGEAASASDEAESGAHSAGEAASGTEDASDTEAAAGGEAQAGGQDLLAGADSAGGEIPASVGAGAGAPGDASYGGVNPVPQRSARRQAWFVSGWLASALAVGAGAGFGILAVIGASNDSVIAGAPVAPATTPSPSVTSGVRPDGTHYGSVKDFLLPIPDGYQAGPDEGGLGNDSTISPDQADPTVALLFGTLPASDMTSAQGAIATGHMSDGAVRTYANSAGSLDVAVTVLRLDPAQSAESTSEFERVVKQSRAYRNGPQVPGHAEALCVLPVTHVGDPLDSMTCLATAGDTLAIVNAEGSVPLDTNAVTELFGRQLDTLKGGLGT